MGKRIEASQDAAFNILCGAIVAVVQQLHELPSALYSLQTTPQGNTTITNLNSRV